MSNIRKKIGSELKAKIALEAVSQLSTLTEIAEKYGVHPITVSKWKMELQKNAARIFEGSKKNKEEAGKDKIIETLYRKVGQREVEIDWLKKKVGLEP